MTIYFWSTKKGFTMCNVFRLFFISAFLLSINDCLANPQIFWETWSDGAAEVSSYQFSQPRYGEVRSGTLQLIYVTEPFSTSQQIKVNNYDKTLSDHTIALKLNIVESWRTGIYEYQVMTSHFVDAQNAFAPLKVTFSSQEWCGITYEEGRWQDRSLEYQIHSYFEGESSRQELSKELRPIDQLLVLARGLMSEGPQGVKEFPKHWIESAKQRRLNHLSLKPYEASVSWKAPINRVSQLGSHLTRPLQYQDSRGRNCTLYIEITSPYRVIEWHCDDGEQALITSSKRLPYWRYTQQNDEKIMTHK